MRFYAIRQKLTGFFLPRPKSGRGGSWIEPTKGCQPYLFTEKRYAKGFLTVWLMGGQKEVACQSSYESFYNDDSYIEVTPQPHRKAEDMEIVTMLLSEA